MLSALRSKVVVDVLSVSAMQKNYGQNMLSYIGNQTIVSHTKAPKMIEMARQSFAKNQRVRGGIKFFEKESNARLFWIRYFFKRFYKIFCDLNAPKASHADLMLVSKTRESRCFVKTFFVRSRLQLLYRIHLPRTQKELCLYGSLQAYWRASLAVPVRSQTSLVLRTISYVSSPFCPLNYITQERLS